MMRITKSDKIDPPGYCIAVCHDIDELELVNHAAKSDILKVNFVQAHGTQTPPPSQSCIPKISTSSALKVVSKIVWVVVFVSTLS